MDKQELQKLSQPVIDVYMGIEDQIMLNIAKRIASGNMPDRSQVKTWQSELLSQLDDLNTEQINTIAKYAGKTEEEIRAMLRKVGYRAVNEIEGALQEGAKDGALMRPPGDMLDSQGLSNLLASYEAQAKEAFNLTNSTMLDQANQKYLDIVNKTVGKVLAGVETPHQALRETIKQFSSEGIPALVDKRGATWTTESYVSMLTRTTSNNVANSMQSQRMDEYGLDLVEISSHSGARPKCEPYQGRIFSISGQHPVYPALSSTSMGDPAGLFGVNCGHVKYPYIEGSKKTYKPVQKRENKRVYDESQEQRKRERRIRYAKRELMLMEEIGDEQGIKEAKTKIRGRQSELREFIKSTGRTRRRNREQIS